MKDDDTTNSHYLSYTSLLSRNVLYELVSERVTRGTRPKIAQFRILEPKMAAWQLTMVHLCQ